MIPSIPQPKAFRVTYAVYVAVFFVYLMAPLAVVAAFAFNDSMFPSLPWNGFTVDWFLNDEEPRLGLFHDRALIESVVSGQEMSRYLLRSAETSQAAHPAGCSGGSAQASM